MKLKLVTSLLLLIGITAEANQKYRINLNHNISANQLEKAGQSFVKFNFGTTEVDRTVGAPELPVKSWLVRGTPAQIKVNLKLLEKSTFEGMPFPVQEQDCRCETEMGGGDYGDDPVDSRAQRRLETPVAVVSTGA